MVRQNRRRVFRGILAGLVALGLVSVSCSDDGPSLNPPSNQSYPVEKDPVYAADSTAVYFVSVDTVHAERTAILTAGADLPIRRRLTIGSDVALADGTSLAVSLSGHELAYLTAGLRHVCTLTSTPSCTSATSDEEAVAFLTDSLIVFGREDSLFAAPISGGSESFVARGWEPRLEGNGQVIFAALLEASGYGVLRYRANGSIDTVYTLAGEGRPRWPDMDTSGQWLAYTMDSSGVFVVHVVDLAQQIDRSVATTRFARTCIISQTVVLFTGANGLLYQVGYRGGNAIPWVYVDEG